MYLRKFIFNLTLVTTLICTAMPDRLLASSDHLDMSSGIVFSSENDALFYNPAVMSVGQRKMLDFSLDMYTLTGITNPILIQGSYVRAENKFGFGFGLRSYQQTYSSQPVTATAGAAYDFGKLQLGVLMTSPISSISPTYQAGFRYGGTQSDISIAGVLHQFPTYLGNYTFGIGFKSGKTMGELDIMGEHDANGNILYSNGSIGIVYIPVEDFTVRVMDYFTLIPQNTLTTLYISIGANIWLSKAFALYGVYNTLETPFILGCKLAF